jgi:hypothetical protein
MKRIGLAFSLLFTLNSLTAQNLYKGGDSLVQGRVLDSLRTLFAQIRNGTLSPSLINSADSALNREIFSDYREEKGTPHIINCYPLSAQQYIISTAFNDSTAALQTIITLVANVHPSGVSFSLPLAWSTRNWQKKQTGNITYYYETNFHEARARAFDSNNIRIARRLNQTPESFRFYLVDNYQQALQFMGYTYRQSSNGRTRSGSLTSAHTIFAVQHNEDFSHDIFHWYSAKVRGAGVKRNAAAEEGLAYTWGNAYYTDSNGNMITQPALIAALRQYLNSNPSVSPWTLFTTNPPILKAFAPEISVRSVISG